MRKLIPIALIIFLSLFFRCYAKGFGVGPIKDGKRPDINDSDITDNNGYVIGNDTKDIYLTFDCGYENGYTEKILDTLKENDVKACFFITGHYLTSALPLVKRMESDGHIVGNHTYKHRDFTNSSNEMILEDVTHLENEYKRLTGNELSKYVRPPRGEYSKASQMLLAENGYKSIFWSLAYVDWYKDKYNGNHYSYNNVMKRIHNGAIILMHSVSKDNQMDLDDIIKELKNRGYNFKSLDDLTRV